MKKPLILITDDEVSILRYVGACLRKEGYGVITASDGEEALARVEEENPNLVILDVVMPRMDGFEVCRRLREWTQTPIIMLSAKGDESDKVKCLDLGADDYIIKPFGAEELIARIKAVLRRAEIAPAPVKATFSSSGLLISFARRQVTVDGKEVKLTPTEYNLLQELVLNAGKVLTHTYLLNKVWGPEYREERDYLHVFIRRLRAKLEPDSAHPRYLVTVPGVGYQFRDTA